MAHFAFTFNHALPELRESLRVFGHTIRGRVTIVHEDLDRNEKTDGPQTYLTLDEAGLKVLYAMCGHALRMIEEERGAD